MFLFSNYGQTEEQRHARLMQQLKDHLEQEKPFLLPELTLKLLAKQLRTNTATLSKVINDRFGCNFNDLINKYRVEVVKRRMQQGEFQYNKLLSIGLDAGFNSKCTFNRAFKRFTGMTPSEFAKDLTLGPGSGELS